MISSQKIRIAGKLPQKLAEQAKLIFLLGFAALLLILAFLFNDVEEIIRGNYIILLSPANLVTDYFALANVGAALFNAAIMMLFSVAMVVSSRTEMTGPLVAAVFTVTGFSLFGKNLYNSLPIILGVICYSKLTGTKFNNHLLPAIYGTALGPLVSEFSFNLGLPLMLGISAGVLLGVLTGLVLPVLSPYFLSFHQGFNLYNIGFTCGIIGTFYIGVLRNFGVELDSVLLVSSGNNQKFSMILYPVFLIIFLVGLANNQWSFRGYGKILNESGRMTPDFFLLSNFGITLINMALLGIIATSYVLLVGGELSGPILGSIFTVVGFGACGKHVKNVVPILFGIFLMGLLNLEDVYSPLALLAALFGTTLAPISGHYGPVGGMVAGAFHVAMTMNISNLHAGMNLYNNGFSGGFVAAALVPTFDFFIQIRRKQFRKG